MAVKPMLFTLALIASALSWPLWLVRGGYRDFLGLNEANVRDAYNALETKGDTWHKLKNVSAEWTRSNEERASKTLAAAILWPWLIFILAWAW